MHSTNQARPLGRSILSLLAALLTVWLAAAGVAAESSELTLEHAEAIALRADPSVQAVESKREAMEALAIASDQLPDPVLQGGLMSLPTDSWELGQEPMTQVVVAVSQKFPRGQSRGLRAEQMLEQAEALGETASDRRLRVLLAVREDYIETLKQVRLAEINVDAEQAFADLAEITEDFYATGRVQQQDVLRAAVELAKVQDRATRIAEEEDRARARLAAWIGAAAWQALPAEWPELGTPATLDRIKDGLLDHPRLAALKGQAAAADTGIELARQRYKPEFGVELSYGGRGGNDLDGSSRADLFSVMLMMDLPLFHKNRQDRYVAASVAESSAALFERDDMYRRMASEGELHAATLQRQLERRRLFEERLLPDAGFNAEAAFSAFQAALENLTTLMRARITEYELQLEYTGLLGEILKTKARLDYLEGERP